MGVSQKIDFARQINSV